MRLVPNLVDREGRSYTGDRERHNLAAALRNSAEFAQRVGRPLVVLQAGFASSERGHKGEFHAGGLPDPGVQERLYEAFAEALDSPPRASRRRAWWSGSGAAPRRQAARATPAST